VRRWLIAAAVLLVIAGGGWLWGSPYLTLWQLKKAADAGDMTAISAKIDYPSVRADLKTQVHERLGRSGGSALDKLGAAVAERFADPVVDAAVTPEMRVRREGLGRFALVSTRGVGPEVTFEMQGLTWRVTAVRLPERLL